jgi:uncharacterized protein
VRKTALVTGASGGIGLELAKVFAREGWDLWLIARDRQRSEEAVRQVQALGAKVRLTLKDLAHPSSARELYDESRKEGVPVEALVNNAGAGDFGAFADVELSRHERIVNLNVLSLTQLSHLFMEPMLAKKRGRILNVASTAAFQPGPLLSVYYASKAYVLHLSEALSYELRGTGVTVTALCPGATATGFQESARMSSSKLFSRAVMEASRVAEAGYQGMMRGQAIVVPGLRNKFLSKSYRFFPRAVVTAVVKRIQESKA